MRKLMTSPNLVLICVYTRIPVNIDVSLLKSQQSNPYQLLVISEEGYSTHFPASRNPALVKLYGYDKLCIS